MTKRRIIFTFVFLSCFLLLYVLSHTAVRESRKSLGASYSMSVSPMPPAFTRMLAGEFKGIAADFLLLEAGAYMGRAVSFSEAEWVRIALVLEQALALDPYFEQTYIYVQGNLPWDAGMPERANELLEISRRHRPWDWRPGYYMGFNDYYFLDNYERASERFIEAARIKNAPVLLAILGGRLALKAGRTGAGISLLKSMLRDPDLDEEKKKEVLDRITALEGVLIVEAAVKKHLERYGEPPKVLRDLVDRGILAELPPNPYKEHYSYDPESGRVYFDKIK